MLRNVVILVVLALVCATGAQGSPQTAFLPGSFGDSTEYIPATAMFTATFFDAAGNELLNADLSRSIPPLPAMRNVRMNLAVVLLSDKLALKKGMELTGRAAMIWGDDPDPIIGEPMAFGWTFGRWMTKEKPGIKRNVFLMEYNAGRKRAWIQVGFIRATYSASNASQQLTRGIVFYAVGDDGAAFPDSDLEEWMMEVVARHTIAMPLQHRLLKLSQPAIVTNPPAPQVGQPGVASVPNVTAPDLGGLVGAVQVDPVAPGEEPGTTTAPEPTSNVGWGTVEYKGMTILLRAQVLAVVTFDYGPGYAKPKVYYCQLNPSDPKTRSMRIVWTPGIHCWVYVNRQCVATYNHAGLVPEGGTR